MFPFRGIYEMFGDNYNAVVERCLLLAHTPQQYVKSMNAVFPQLKDPELSRRVAAEIWSAATIHWESEWLIRHADPGVPEWLTFPVKEQFSGPHQTVVKAEAKDLLHLLATRGTEIHSIVGMEEWMGEEE